MVTKSSIKLQSTNRRSKTDDSGFEKEPATEQPISEQFTSEQPINNPDITGIEGTTSEPATNDSGGGSENILKIKGRRGRPKGSKNATKPTQAGIFEERVIKPVKKSKSQKVMDDEEAIQVTQTILTIAEGFSVSLLGEEARLNETEKLLLFSSIPKMLTTLKTETIERVSGVLYPLTALAGIGAYGLRLSAIYAEKMKREETDHFSASQVVVNGEIPMTETQPEFQNGTNEEIWNKTIPLTPRDF